MEWNEIISTLLYAIITGAVGVLTTFATLWIKQKMGIAQQNAKTEEGKKYLGMLEETIVNCVLTTNQTYVSNLKKDDMFDAEAQKNAFKMTYDSVMNVLSADAMKFLNETYNDVPKLIESMIEAQVNKNK
jgi:hypothetical protein